MTDTDWSVSETEVLAGVREVLESDLRGVLATIIDVEGSAYRRPGQYLRLRYAPVRVRHWFISVFGRLVVSPDPVPGSGPSPASAPPLSRAM